MSGIYLTPPKAASTENQSLDELRPAPSLDDNRAAFERSNLGLELSPGRFRLNNRGLQLMWGVHNFPDDAMAKRLNTIVKESQSREIALPFEYIRQDVINYVERQSLSPIFHIMPILISPSSHRSGIILMKAHCQFNEGVGGDEADLVKAISYLTEGQSISVSEHMPLNHNTRLNLFLHEFEARVNDTSPNSEKILRKGHAAVVAQIKAVPSLDAAFSRCQLTEALFDNRSWLMMWSLSQAGNLAPVDQLLNDAINAALKGLDKRLGSQDGVERDAGVSQALVHVAQIAALVLPTNTSDAWLQDIHQAVELAEEIDTRADARAKDTWLGMLLAQAELQGRPS